ncbi:extracellular solute-binding protein [Brevibacterium litoralis]|uniref:extracellular solute-binding protein n=1 Tax=Brevibacterium litoralis TaxID=3138935 RepID=UPI0032EB5E0B
MKKTLATTLLAGTSALLVTGCMSGAGGSTEVDASVFADPVAGELPADSLAGVDMTFVSWGGEFQNVQSAAFSDPFSEITGATVLPDGPTDQAKLEAQVEAGNVSWDVINSAPTYNAAHCGTLYEELDFSLIDTSKIPEGMPTGDCYVPSLSYVYTFFYDVERYGDDPPTSWADFFDTESYPGTRAIDGRATPTSGTYEAALMADGVAPDDLYPLDTDRAIARFADIEDDTVYWTSGAEQTQMIQGGEADMIMAWSGRVFEANEAGADFAPVWEQGIMANDSFSIAKDTENLVAAHAYINHALGAGPQTEMAEGSSYSPVNVDAEPNLSPAAERFDVSRPEVSGVTIPQNAEYWGEHYAELSASWQSHLNS